MVAMVTNTVEGGQKKCEHYWPEQGTKEYGPFKVTLTAAGVCRLHHQTAVCLRESVSYLLCVSLCCSIEIRI